MASKYRIPLYGTGRKTISTVDRYEYITRPRSFFSAVRQWLEPCFNRMNKKGSPVFKLRKMHTGIASIMIMKYLKRKRGMEEQGVKKREIDYLHGFDWSCLFYKNRYIKDRWFMKTFLVLPNLLTTFTNFNYLFKWKFSCIPDCYNVKIEKEFKIYKRGIFYGQYIREKMKSPMNLICWKAQMKLWLFLYIILFTITNY